MERIDLGGAWRVTRAGSTEAIPAAVPGNVHTDLLAAGKIPDPYYRDNEDRLQWIGLADWEYRRMFSVPAGLLRCDAVRLCCDGLDTLATIRINGRRVGQTDNMFRRYEFDVRNVLRPGENEISVRFGSAERYVARRDRARHLPEWSAPRWVAGRCQLRKEQCNFGWDWGPTLVTCGIWRDIYLLACDEARLTDVHVQQTHRGGQVKLEVTAEAEREKLRRGPLRAAMTVSLNGQPVAEADAPFRRGQATVTLPIRTPRLWWPNGMGDQPLYEVTVDLLDARGAALDTQSRRIGLRTLRLVRKKDRWGESFHFAVNGNAFFAKGANWIPADTFATRVTRDRYAALLRSAAAAHMNMLRVWGGGIYEDDVFYDLCDELGICIWQDFMFACSTYPTFDEGFMDSVEAEARDNVRRLRHHPCMALWCGNNELEQGLVGPRWSDTQMSWADYRPLFDKLLAKVVRQLDPQRDYWPGSPHTPVGDRAFWKSPESGDVHLWDVWHGGQPFESYRTTQHRFVSEFGFQSFPEPRTVRGYTRPEDRNVTAPVMEHHQRSPIGNAAILHYMLDWFRMPDGFDRMLWLSQILQGLAIQYAVEHWRRNMPRTMGALYWQLNDCWPVASWAGIDYHGRWKALHYMAARFFAPVLLSAVEDTARGRVDLHVTSDRLKDCAGRITWTLMTTDGEPIARTTERVDVPAGKTSRTLRLELAEPVTKHGAEKLMLFADIAVGREIVSSTYAAFAKPKQMNLPEPQITARVKAVGDGVFLVRLRASRPALWVWLELTGTDATYSDNFFHLSPGDEVEILIHPASRLTVRQFQQKLKVRSLVDTY